MPIFSYKAHLNDEHDTFLFFADGFVPEERSNVTNLPKAVLPPFETLPSYLIASKILGYATYQDEARKLLSMLSKNCLRYLNTHRPIMRQFITIKPAYLRTEKLNDNSMIVHGKYEWRNVKKYVWEDVNCYKGQCSEAEQKKIEALRELQVKKGGETMSLPGRTGPDYPKPPVMPGLVIVPGDALKAFEKQISYKPEELAKNILNYE